MRLFPYLYAFVVWLFLRSLFLAASPLVQSFKGAAPSALLERILYLLVYCAVGTYLFHGLVRTLFGGWNSPSSAKMVLFREKPFKPLSLLLWIGTGAILFCTVFTISQFRNGEIDPRSLELRNILLRGDSESVWLMLTIALITPAAEEYFYRGLLLNFLSGDRGGALPLLFQAVLFGISHDPIAAPAMIVFGLALGIISSKYGPAASAVTHAIYNSMILASELTLRS